MKVALPNGERIGRAAQVHRRTISPPQTASLPHNCTAARQQLWGRLSSLRRTVSPAGERALACSGFSTLPKSVPGSTLCR
jgi:hypothetical protein